MPDWSARASKWKQALRAMGGQLFTFQPPDFNSPRTLKHQHRCTLTLVAGRNGVCDDCMLRLGNSPHPVAYWCAACDYDLCLPCVKSGRKVITCNHHNRKLWNLLLKVAKSTLVRGLQMLRPVLATDYQPRCPTPSRFGRARAQTSRCTRLITPWTSGVGLSTSRPRSRRACKCGHRSSAARGLRLRATCPSPKWPQRYSSA